MQARVALLSTSHFRTLDFGTIRTTSMITVFRPRGLPVVPSCRLKNTTREQCAKRQVARIVATRRRMIPNTRIRGVRRNDRWYRRRATKMIRSHPGNAEGIVPWVGATIEIEPRKTFYFSSSAISSSILFRMNSSPVAPFQFNSPYHQFRTRPFLSIRYTLGHMSFPHAFQFSEAESNATG